MNMVNLQLDFYRRFNDAASRLVFGKSGYLLPLLGIPALHGSKSISCTLSMGVAAVARRLNSGQIKIESTNNNVCTCYNLKELFRGENNPERTMLELFKKSGFNGAEILYDSEIAPGYDYMPSLKCAVLQAIIKLNNAELPSAEDAAILCGKGADAEYYTALFSSKRGWCTYISGHEIKNYPLPMTGLLILSVRTRRHKLPRIHAVEKEFQRLRNVHPMIYNYFDIEPDMLEDGDYTLLKYIAYENLRIDAARKVLRACRIDRFSDIVNESAEDFSRWFGTNDEQSFLSRIMPDINGCMCARPSENGVYSIIDAELADFVIERVKNKFEDRFGYAPQFALASTL